jgi:hypothetical protein
MLKQNSIRDIPGDRPRLWMLDDCLDVIVWFEPDGSIYGFQLCYDKTENEKSITWNHNGHFSYHHIDSGESDPGDYKKTPVLLVGADFDHRYARDQFLIRSFHIHSRLVDFICEKLNQAYALATKLPFDDIPTPDTAGLRLEIEGLPE